MANPRSRWLLPLLAVATGSCSCEDDPKKNDGGTGDAGDAEQRGCTDLDSDRRGTNCNLGEDCDDSDPTVWDQHTSVRWVSEQTGVAAAATRIAEVMLDHRACAPVTLALQSDSEEVVTVQPTVELDRGEQRAEVILTGVAEGQATITASAQGLLPGVLEVVTVGAERPQCTGEVTGTLRAGSRVEVGEGTLRPTAVWLPEAATEIEPVEVSARCAQDLALGGFVPLGPAVELAPTAHRFLREVPVQIPLRAALLPTAARPDHVVIAYEAPGISARIVPFANLSIRGTPDESFAYFETPRLGTFQAIVRSNVNTRTRTRRFTFRSIVGISMGAGGAALAGFENPELWDFVGPMGGPTDWQYLLHYIDTYHLGGFCTAEQGLVGTVCAVPESTQLYEHTQDFEHWFYEDEYSGQGGTFDRHEYVQIFRDLALGFGNPNSENPDSFVTPVGVADSERARTDEDRCARPVVIDSGYYDDEYNPDGDLPVITFCDGNELPGDTGTWDPSRPGYYPMEVALAVDVNGNGLRDRGEPIIKAARERFSDTGIDGAFSANEEGFAAADNPDPAGDDYDFQFNPTGTELDWNWQAGEAFDDFGLDGVPGTPQAPDGGFDSGEGNGVFDESRGLKRFTEHNPRRRALDADVATMDRLDVYADGGVRDLFNFAVVSNHFFSSLVARVPEEVRLFNGFGSLYGDVGASDDTFDFTRPDYTRIGRYALVRYGSLDASEDDKRLGDGGHVGTVSQILNRLVASVYVASDRWPGGDRQRWDQDITTDDDCSTEYLCTFDFTADDGRTGPVSILLPPGYHDAQFQDMRYPVVYFGHGYGQEPNDLILLAVVFANYMVSPAITEERRLQKFIMVFPDGRCRGDECINGTFYANSVRSDGPQMIDFLESLVRHVDATFRTRQPEEVEVRY